MPSRSRIVLRPAERLAGAQSAPNARSRAPLSEPATFVVLRGVVGLVSHATMDAPSGSWATGAA